MRTDLSLTVAMLTYRRRSDLIAILPLLVGQARTVADRLARVRVLVVDNSPDDDERDVVANFAATQEPGLVGYAHEPKPGIPAGRNKALDSSTSSDLLVFIDDDERPSEHWLQLLLDTFGQHDAVGVVGSVVSTYETPPPAWIQAGRFFERLRRPTGSTVPVAATNNLLIDLRVVRAHGLRFNENLGMNGSDDSVFTRQLARHGRLVWCDEATVTDPVPAERLTRGYVVRHALSTGNGQVLASVMVAEGDGPRLRTRMTSAGQGLVRIAGGGARVALGVIARRIDQRARGVRTLARGVGMVLGAAGLSYLEYARPGERPIEIARR